MADEICPETGMAAEAGLDSASTEAASCLKQGDIMRFAILAAAAALSCAGPSGAAVVYQKTFTAVGRDLIWEWGASNAGLGVAPGDYTITVEAQGPIARMNGGYAIYKHYDYQCRSGPETPWQDCGGNDGGAETAFAGGAVQTMTGAFTILPPYQTETDDWRETGSYSLRYFLIDYDVGNFDPTTITVTIADAAAVPEPATWLMLIAGFGLMGAAVRRHYASAPMRDVAARGALVRSN